MATTTLPVEMGRFFKPKAEILAQRSLVPDRRRMVDPKEGPRHYLNLDLWEERDSIGFWTQEQAAKRVGEATVRKRGTLFWTILGLQNQLTRAFLDHDSVAIIRTAGDMSHYVADACVPLHCTSNYNGQQTGQQGIHALWESRIPEVMSDEISLWTGPATYIKQPRQAVFDVIRTSFASVDSVLRLEMQLSQRIGSDQKFGTELRKGKPTRVISPLYARRYARNMDDMVAKRMRVAIKLVGDLWYTAWVDAGQPDLRHFGKSLPRPEDLPDWQASAQPDSASASDACESDH
jgi:hypothetical protein